MNRPLKPFWGHVAPKMIGDKNFWGHVTPKQTAAKVFGVT